MAKPKLLLFDEPSLRLAPIVMQNIITVIKEINKNGISVLLVEQDVILAFSITEQIYVPGIGEIKLEGKTKDMMNNEAVRKSFFGG